jgi:thiol-disulfide isomerase/thioredoxin
MKKIILLLSVVMMITQVMWAQSEKEEADDMEQAATIEDKEMPDLIGQLSIKQLYAFPAFDWESEFEFDEEEQALLGLFSKAMQTHHLYVFLGTWCSDSHEMIPSLIAILQNTGIGPDQYTLYGLDEKKQSPDGFEKKMDVNFVPTIILVDKKLNKEVGRIVEQAPNGLINDLTQILEK